MHNNFEPRDNLNEGNQCCNQLKLLINAFNALEIAICIMDGEGLFVYVNDVYCRLYGYQQDELLGQPYHLVIPPDESDQYWNEHNKFMKEDSVYSGERIIKQKNGKTIHALITIVKIKDGMNNYYKLITLTDITEKIKAELEVKKFMMAVGQTVDWVIITNKHGIIEYANESVARITGYSIEEIIGKTPSIWKSDKYNQDFYKNLWDTILSGKPYQNVIINRKKNGELFHLSQSISPLKSEDGEILYFVSTGKDITESVVLEDKLYYLSYYDMITGLPNRTEFSRRITQAITNAEVIEELIRMAHDLRKSHEEEKELGLNEDEIAFYYALTADDAVKKFMDDEVLKKMAQELTEAIRNNITIDWSIRRSAQAGMRRIIKRLLAKYNYPPEEAKNALKIVMKQAEKMCGNVYKEEIEFDVAAEANQDYLIR